MIFLPEKNLWGRKTKIPNRAYDAFQITLLIHELPAPKNFPGFAEKLHCCIVGENFFLQIKVTSVCLQAL